MENEAPQQANLAQELQSTCITLLKDKKIWIDFNELLNHAWHQSNFVRGCKNDKQLAINQGKHQCEIQTS
jgi:pectate lyase